MVEFVSSAIHFQNLLFHINKVLTEKGANEVTKWKNPYCDWVSKLRLMINLTIWSSKCSNTE